MDEKYPVAAPYKFESKLMDKITEFNIIYEKERDSYDKLLTFIDTYPSTRINISTTTWDKETAKTLTRYSDKVYFKLNWKDLNNIQEIKDTKCRFFFDNTVPVSNYSELEYYISIGVTDIYLADDLMFNLADIHNTLRENNIQSRIIANHIPCTTPNKSYNPKSPILRPEESDFLQRFIDIFEFDCGKPYDFMELETLIKVWFIDKNWPGLLNEINLDLSIPIQNNSLPSHSMEKRFNCGKRCISRNSPCNTCNKWIDFSNTLSEKGVVFRTNKNN